MSKIAIYSTGTIDIFGEPSIEDIKEIDNKIKSNEIKIVNKELNVWFNDSYEMPDTILSEFIKILEHSSKITTVLIDLLQKHFVETIKLYKHANGLIDKHYNLHDIAHFTEFHDSQRSNFYLELFRSASPQFEDLTLPADIRDMSFIEDSQKKLRLTKIRVYHPRVTPRLSSVLTENTLTTLRSIELCVPATAELWHSLTNNTHVVNLKCRASDDFAYESFADAVRHNKTLKRLFVSWSNEAGDVSRSFEALKHNQSITHLHLEKVRGPMNASFFNALVDYLPHTTSLTHFHFSLIHDMKREEEEIFYDSLNASSIPHVNLQWSDYDVTLLADFITKNKTLLSLSVISRTPFDQETSDRMLKALEQNETICYWHDDLTAQYRDSLRSITCEVNQVLRRNKKKREVYINHMVVLLFNIARGSDALQLLPKELWLKIFAQVPLIGFEYRFDDILATLFRDAQIRQVVICPNKIN